LSYDGTLNKHGSTPGKAFVLKNFGGTAFFNFQLSRTPLFDMLQQFGFQNADIGGPGVSVPVNMTITIDGADYNASFNTIYTARQGLKGVGR